MNASTRSDPPDGGRGQGNASGASQTLILHPATGELFDPDAIDREPPENLADLLLALREHAGAVKRAEALVADELARRLALRDRRKWVLGDYEVEQATRNARVWDGDELARVLADLVADGVVNAREVIDVVELKYVVHGREALRLQSQLQGEAHECVAECWHWERKPGGLSVVRSLPLVADGDEPTV